MKESYDPMDTMSKWLLAICCMLALVKVIIGF